MPGRMVAGAWPERKLAMEDITSWQMISPFSHHLQVKILAAIHTWSAGPQRTAMHSGTYMRYVH